MIYHPSLIAIIVFALLVVGVLGLSVFLARTARSTRAYYAAHGQIPWWVNGVAFAGDYLSAASFLGICGAIATGGFDGFLYSIGFLAGWVVALFVVAEPLRQLGKYTFADALDARFHSRGIRLTAAISTLVISLFYLIPQMVGAGTLIKPLLGLPYSAGVGAVGGLVIIIVATAGMVSTTWVQFIKGGLLVLFCGLLTVLILAKGLTTETTWRKGLASEIAAGREPLAAEGGWATAKEGFVRFAEPAGGYSVWKKDGDRLLECQALTTLKTGAKLVGGRPQTDANDLRPVGGVTLAGGSASSGAVGPIGFIDAIADGTVSKWKKTEIAETDGKTTVFHPVTVPGEQMLAPGQGLFSKLASGDWRDRLGFISLMLALFLGTASLPHILIRYYTVKDAAAARSSTVVGIGAIGAFYTLTLFLGLAAMVSGVLDPTSENMAAPLLARSHGEIPFAIICAIAFTTILGTVAGLIIAASGAIVHDLVGSLARQDLSEGHQVALGRWSAVAVGLIAMGLGLACEKFNISFLVAWAFNIAASANLPALAMLLFWRGTTGAGVAWAITVGLASSLAWVLLTVEAYVNLYGLPKEQALMPFSHPALVTVPLGFLVLIAVSLATKKRADRT